jgi:plastocyanin
MQLHQFITAAAAIAALGLTVAGCSEQPAPGGAVSTQPPRTDAPAAAVDTTASGVIEATVTYAGAPRVEAIRINKDVEQCGAEATNERIVTGPDGALAYAVVSVVGLDGPAAARPAQIDQRGCQFRPRVVAMQTGEIEIRNSDGILHNVHTYSEANAPINKAQPKFKTVMTEKFTEPEIVKMTCDIHSWMLGWVAVLPHPYFGVTDERGVVRVEGVPAGTHTVETWHEELGRRTEDVVVKPGETTRVTLAYPETG